LTPIDSNTDRGTASVWTLDPDEVNSGDAQDARSLVRSEKEATVDKRREGVGYA
jgi:hypothetical protein